MRQIFGSARWACPLSLSVRQSRNNAWQRLGHSLRASSTTTDKCPPITLRAVRSPLRRRARGARSSSRSFCMLDASGSSTSVLARAAFHLYSQDHSRPMLSGSNLHAACLPPAPGQSRRTWHTLPAVPSTSHCGTRVVTWRGCRTYGITSRTVTVAQLSFAGFYVLGAMLWSAEHLATNSTDFRLCFITGRWRMPSAGNCQRSARRLRSLKLMDLC